jgi:hypothetical protein
LEFIEAGENNLGKLTLLAGTTLGGTGSLTLQSLVPRPKPLATNTVSTTATSPQQNVPSPLVLYGLGAFGAFLKEFFRWRKISERRRFDLFFKPAYLFFSAVFIASGGLVGELFGSWSASGPMGVGMGHVVAWVAGVGLEEVVKRAAQLRIWTPAVAHGTDSDAGLGPEQYPASALEFLRC